MSDWVFLGEQTEAGVVFQLGMNCLDGQYFRFEPIATRLRGNAAGALRQELENRKLIETDPNQGIISAIGPVFYQGRYWLGWKDRNGQNIFAIERKIRKPLREELADLYQLINSYKLWRQLGLTVGRPEWSRLFIDGRGIFMLDPKPAFYLNQPWFNPPIFLERCRPAEEYRGLPLESGDIFYLGLIIYYYLTGEIPFSLRKGWPIQKILAGKITNPQLYRSILPPGLSRMITLMLAPEPSQRPSLEEIAELWNEYLKLDQVFVNPSFNDDQSTRVRIKNRNTLNKAVSKLVISLSVLGLLITGCSIFYLKFFNRVETSPLETAANFYQEMGRVNFGNRKGVSAQIGNDVEAAAKQRLEMVRVLLSKPVFEVDQMKIIKETPETSIIEADLIWWEWSVEGWARRHSRERLVFRKKGKQMKLESRDMNPIN